MRILELDGLRAVAVMLVFVAHSGMTLPGGGLGVDIFFAISGFIITQLLLREIDETGLISIRSFLKRRVVRLWPALFALLFVFISFEVISGFILGEWDTRGFMAIGVVAVSALNYARALELGSGGLLGHTWSLAVEEQFYLIWPLALLVISKLPQKKLVSLLLIIAGLIAIWRAWIGLNGSWWYAYHALETRADGLVFGALLAIIGPEKFKRFVPLCPVPIAFILFLCVSGDDWYSPWMLLGGHSLLAISSAWLVCACAVSQSPFTIPLTSKSVIWIGDRSYSLYLWHYPVLGVLDHVEMPALLSFCSALAASLAISDLSYRFIERPIRRRFSPTDQLQMRSASLHDQGEATY